MSRKRIAVIDSGLVLVVGVAVGAESAALSGGSGEQGDSNNPLTGSNPKRATAAVFETTGRGTVVETEVGDDGDSYGVEILLDGGPNDSDGPNDD